MGRDAKNSYEFKAPKKKGKISEFFNHLVTYGGFSFENGVMKVWGDTSLFASLNGFTKYVKGIKTKLGQDADEILYWLGCLYGRNSTYLLLQKFGYDKKKIPDFINGATQDGFGYVELQNLKDDGVNLDADLKIIGAPLAIQYKNLFGNQKTPLDFYLCGILAGGSEPLFNRNIQCTETKCIAQGNEYCFCHVNNVKNYVAPEFFKKIGLDEEAIRKKTEKMAKRRKINFKLFQRKDIKFGDGTFILNGCQGFNLASYEHVVLDKIIFLLLGEKPFFEIKEEMATAYIQDSFIKTLKTETLSQKSIIAVLERIKMFGYGSLEIYRFQKNLLIIKNENNPYINDQKAIFGKTDNLSLDMLCRILRNSFKKYFNRDVSIKPMKVNPSTSFLELRF